MAILNVTVNDQHGQPVEDVLVKLVRLDGTVEAQIQTNSWGVAVFDPPAGTYDIRMFKTGMLFDGQLGTQNASPQRVTVTDPQVSYTVIGRVPELPESTDDRLCLVTGYVTDPLFDTGLDHPLDPASRFRLLFSLDDRVRVFPPELVAMRSSYVKPGDDGLVQIALARGVYYTVSTTERQWRIHVPEAPSARLEDLLFPWAAISPSALGMIINTTEQTRLRISWSDGDTSRDFIPSEWDISYDESLMEVSFDDDDPLLMTIHALSATGPEGTYITFDRDEFHVWKPPKTPRINVMIQIA